MANEKKRVWGAPSAEMKVGDAIKVELGEFAPGRAPRISLGDSFVLFQSAEDDLTFWGTGGVAEVSPTISEGGANNQRTQWHATVKVKALIAPQTSLSDVRYSLERVFRYEKPKSHFVRPYIRLSANDAETILRGDVHWERTAAGILVGILSVDERMEVIAEAIRQGIRQYGGFSRLLYQRILTQHLAFAELVVETAVLSRKVQSKIEGLRGVAFETEPNAIFLEDLEGDALIITKNFERIGEDPFKKMIEREGQVATSTRLQLAFRPTSLDLLRLAELAP